MNLSDAMYHPEMRTEWIAKNEVYVPQKNISLRRLSMISLIRNLWTDGSLIDEIESMRRAKKKLSYRILCGKASEIIKQLELPRLLIHEMLVLMEYMCKDFVLYLERLLSNEFFSYEGSIIDIVRKIQWDMHGSIDEVHTFKTMKYANHHYNFIVSSLYCLEDDINSMWSQLEPVYRPIFSLRKMYSGGFDSYPTFIIHYWTCRVKNRVFLIDAMEDPAGLFSNIEHCSIDLKMAAIALHSYYIYAFKYFWRRLGSTERKLAINILIDAYVFDDLSNIVKCHETLKNSVEIMLFVLSQVDDEQRVEIISRCLYHVLINFWQSWQVHHEVVPIFEKYLEFLNQFEYRRLFSVVPKLRGNYLPKENLLFRIWKGSPTRFQYLVTEADMRNILLKRAADSVREMEETDHLEDLEDEEDNVQDSQDEDRDSRHEDSEQDLQDDEDSEQDLQDDENSEEDSQVNEDDGC